MSLVRYKEPVEGEETVEFEANDGDEGGKIPIHDIRDIAGTVTVGGTVAVTGVSTAANQASTNTKLDTLNAAVATAANQATTNTKLDTLIAQGDPATGVIGQNTDIDQTSEAIGSQACSLGVWIKNISVSNQKVYIFYGTATTSNGWELAVGEQHFFPCTNVSQLEGIASADNAKVSWHAV